LFDGTSSQWISSRCGLARSSVIGSV
jgi:hypothetical protein